MLTYTGALAIYQDLTSNSETANTTRFGTIFNEGNRKVLNAFDWYFLERSADITTVASQQFYDLPYNFKNAISVTVTVGTTVYSPREAPSRKFWDRLNSNTSVTGDTPSYFYIFNGQVGLCPMPASASNTITVHYKIRIKDISMIDFTTGSVTTATVDSTAIVGTGTSWTAKMDDQRWIRITDSNSANTGDGEWYEISSIADGTHLVLKENYAGTSISGGTAVYIIGQVSQLPEDFQMIPLYYAIWIYWATIGGDQNKAMQYKTLYDEGIRDMNSTLSKSQDPVLDNDEVYQSNPNLFVTS